MTSPSDPDPRRWWALFLLCAAQFLVILDTSIVGIALPTATARPQDGGRASGLVNTTYQVGSAIGLAVMVAIAGAKTSSLLAAGAETTSAVTARVLHRVCGRGRGGARCGGAGRPRDPRSPGRPQRSLAAIM